MRDDRPKNLLFIDESGKAKDPTDSLFVLAGVALEGDAVDQYVQAADQLKLEFFEDLEFTFHAIEMNNLRSRYGFQGDDSRRDDFSERLGQLIDATPHVVFGSVLRRDAIGQFTSTPPADDYIPGDMYVFALQLLLERYVDYLDQQVERPVGQIALEAQGQKENAENQLALARLLLQGTQWVPERAFRSYLRVGVDFHPKAGSHPLELADLTAYSLREWARNGFRIESGRWGLLGSRVYWRDDRRMGKFGIKVWPDYDIRGAVEAHRDSLQERPN